jgi:hypothetical protein
MRHQVIVLLNKGIEHQFTVDESVDMAPDVARTWLDAQFTSLDCEPLRASGKVLTADKVLRIAEAAGARQFADTTWSTEFVQAVHASLVKPMIRVDVPAMAVTF